MNYKVKGKLVKILIVFFIIIVFAVVTVEVINNKKLMIDEEETSMSSSFKAVMIVSNQDNILNKDSIASGRENESVILVKENGSFNGDSLTINKIGNSKKIEMSEKEGLNSALLVQKNSKMNIINSKINTDADGSCAVYSIGENSEISIKNSDISTSKDNSSVVCANDRGTVNSSNNKISTNGNNSYALLLNNGTLNISNDTIESTNTAIAKISGDANLKIDNTKLKLSENQDNTMFLVIDGKAKVDLNNNEIDYAGESLFKVLANELEESTLEINANNQKLNGNIELDAYSKVSLNLVNSSYTGRINSEKAGKEVDFSLDANSTLTMNGDWYVSSIKDEDPTLKNINSNGSTIYYDSSNEANSWLKGKTVYLFDGGKLVPSK